VTLRRYALQPRDQEDLVDPTLSEALAPVLRDLGNSGSLMPEVRDEQWAGLPGQVTTMLHSPDGSAQGVSAMAAEPLPRRIASVADQVQEWAVGGALAGGPARGVARVPAAPGLPSADGGGTGRPRRVDLPQDR
jgi:hypothetical protein